MNQHLIVPHVAGCPSKFRLHGHTDDAKRVADGVNKYTQTAAIGVVWETVQGRWLAFDLNDGRPEGTLYDTQRDAARHTDPYKHFYVRLIADLMTVCEAEIQLQMHRRARLKGFPQADPDHKNGGPGIISRIGTDEQVRMIRSLR